MCILTVCSQIQNTLNTFGRYDKTIERRKAFDPDKTISFIRFFHTPPFQQTPSEDPKGLCCAKTKKTADARCVRGHCHQPEMVSRPAFFRGTRMAM